MKPSTKTSHISLLSLSIFSAGVAATASTIKTDVVVVGGGLSGLTSAYVLSQAGFTPIVLEAKDAIGGRCRSIQRQSGPGIIELGATWINNVTQPDVFELTQRFGLDTTPQYYEGDLIHQDIEGSVYRVGRDDVVNTLDPYLQELVLRLYGTIEMAAEQIDLRNFDEFPEEFDVTMAEWVAQQNETFAESAHINATMSGLTAQLVGREASEVGAHYMLDYIKSGGSLEKLGGEDNMGAQYLKVKQGTTAICQALADALEPESVQLNTPVEAITHCNDHVIVAASTGQLYKTKKVILANPTNTYAGIKFVPALPAEKKTLISSTNPGIYAKLILSYPEPWWRDAGLIGEFVSLMGPVCFTWDTSDLSLEQYSLAIFVAGDIASTWHALPSENEKQAAVVKHLAELAAEVGGSKMADKARNTLEINMAEWTLEEYLDGGPTSSMGTGMLRKYGNALREPFGDLYFGGGETAFEGKGYLEGAVRAGKRAAREVIDAFELESE